MVDSIFPVWIIVVCLVFVYVTFLTSDWQGKRRFSFDCAHGMNCDWPVTTHAMEERCASVSTGSDVENENSEVSMRTLLQTMQAQMVSLVQKVSDIEKNVESEKRS